MVKPSSDRNLEVIERFFLNRPPTRNFEGGFGTDFDISDIQKYQSLMAEGKTREATFLSDRYAKANKEMERFRTENGYDSNWNKTGATRTNEGGDVAGGLGSANPLDLVRSIEDWLVKRNAPKPTNTKDDAERFIKAYDSMVANGGTPTKEQTDNYNAYKKYLSPGSGVTGTTPNQKSPVLPTPGKGRTDTGGVNPYLDDDLVRDVSAALRETRKERAQQNRNYDAERPARLFEAQKVWTDDTYRTFQEKVSEWDRRMAGEYTKQMSDPMLQRLSLQGKADPTSKMFQALNWHYRHENAVRRRANVALMEALRGGKVLQKNEIDLLVAVFGDDFTKSLDRPEGQKFIDAANFANQAYRAIRLGLDRGFLLNNAKFLTYYALRTGKLPGELKKVKDVGGWLLPLQKVTDEHHQNYIDLTTQIKKDGKDFEGFGGTLRGITDEFGVDPTMTHEEMFAATQGMQQYADVIRARIAKAGATGTKVKAIDPFMLKMLDFAMAELDKPERAMNVYVNSLRVQRFESMAKQFESYGYDRAKHPEVFRGIADYVMDLSGSSNYGKRGEGPDGRIMRDISKWVFLAPRFTASQMKLNPINPVGVMMAGKRMQDSAEALKTGPGIDAKYMANALKGGYAHGREWALDVLTPSAIILGLALYTQQNLGPSDRPVETRPEVADAGNFRIGGTEINGLAAYLTEIRTAATAWRSIGRVSRGEQMSGRDNLADYLANFTTSKFSLPVGMGLQWATGRNYNDPEEEADALTYALKFAPLIAESLVDAMRKGDDYAHPLVNAMLTGPANYLGLGTRNPSPSVIKRRYDAPIYSTRKSPGEGVMQEETEEVQVAPPEEEDF